MSLEVYGACCKSGGARSDEKTRAQLEHAQVGADARREVCAAALMTLTQQPMDSFDAKVWRSFVRGMMVRRFRMNVEKSCDVDEADRASRLRAVKDYQLSLRG